MTQNSYIPVIPSYPETVVMLSGATTREEVFKILADALSAQVSCDAITIFDVDYDRAQFKPQLVQGEQWRNLQMENLTFACNKGILGSIVRNKRGELINNAHLDPRSFYPDGLAVREEQLIAIPMLLADRCSGILAISRFSKIHFEKTDFELTQFLASASAMSLNTISLVSDLNTEKGNLKALLQSIPDHPIHVDRHGHILTRGISLSNNSLSSIYEVFPVHVVETFLENIENICEGRDASQFEYEIELDGGMRVFEARIVSVRHSEFLLLSREITVLKNNEAALRKAKIEAEKLMMVKQDFLAKMSHELRTPINGVLGLANLMDQSTFSTTNREYLTGIKTSGEHLLSVINDILDLSKIEAGKMDIEKVDFNPQQLMGEVTKIVKSQADAKGLTLSIHGAGNVHSLSGDPVRLKQILLNLLSNAIKFTEKGDVTLTWRLDATAENNVALRCSVTDTGIGIATEKIDSIFESFVQGDSGTTVRFGGTGLGLAIVKKLVHMQQGTINVVSQPGCGSTFTFEIPYQHGKEIILSPEAVSFHQFHGNILLAEDNPINQLVAKRTLETWGLTVEIAENGIEALAKLRAKKFDLVIMDVQMPEMDGFEATEIIRTHFPKELRSIPIIAMTASVLYSPRERVIEAGMDDYIAKPFQPGELNKLLYTYLRHCVAERVPHPTEAEADFDLSYLEKISPGNQAFKLQMIEIFETEANAFLANIKVALSGKNYRKIAQLSHAFKPVGAYIGLQTLPAKLGELEQAANNARAGVITKLMEETQTLITSSVGKIAKLKLAL